MVFFLLILVSKFSILLIKGGLLFFLIFRDFLLYLCENNFNIGVIKMVWLVEI